MKNERGRENRANKILRDKKVNKFIIIGVVVVAVLIIGFAVSNIKFSTKTNAALPIDGIKCETMEMKYVCGRAISF